MQVKANYLIYSMFLLSLFSLNCGGKKEKEDSQAAISVPIAPKPRTPHPARVPTGGQTLPENIDVKFVNSGHITNQHFNAAKKFLETNYNLVSKDNAKVEIILTTAIAERLEQYLDRSAQQKLKNDQALVIFLRRNPEVSNILPALNIDNVDVNYAVLGLRNINNKDVLFAIDKTPSNALEFCDLIEGLLDKLKIAGACKTR